MGGRGSKSSWLDDLQRQKWYKKWLSLPNSNSNKGDQSFKEGTGNKNLDDLAKSIGFDKVSASNWHRTNKGPERLSNIVLGAMINEVGRLDRKFNLIKKYKTELQLGRLRKAAGMVKGNNQILAFDTNDMDEKYIYDKKKNMRSNYVSKSGSAKSALQAVQHTALHEYGHMVAKDFKNKTGDDLATRITNYLERTKGVKWTFGNDSNTHISAYGSTNNREWPAEIFAQAFGKHGKQNTLTRALKSVLRDEGGYKF